MQIRKRRVYNLKCKVRCCDETFKSIKDWNRHHLPNHKQIAFICDVCGKIRTTASGFHVHQYVQQARNFVCNRCDKYFTFKSEMVANKNLHQCTKLHAWFASGCKRAYRWPQDLERHICTHVAEVKKCQLCMYSTNEPWMMDQHMNIHGDTKKYKCCKGCDI